MAMIHHIQLGIKAGLSIEMGFDIKLAGVDVVVCGHFEHPDPSVFVGGLIYDTLIIYP